MPLSDDLITLLEYGIDAYANKDFLTADHVFATIAEIYPTNWAVKYFFAMTLCAKGDFSEARLQLFQISMKTDEPIWQQVARSGMELVNKKEQNIRQSLSYLFEF